MLYPLLWSINYYRKQSPPPKKNKKQKQIHLYSPSTMAFNKLLVCAVFVAAFYFASAAPMAMYRLLSERPGLFVEALSD